MLVKKLIILINTRVFKSFHFKPLADFLTSMVWKYYYAGFAIMF